MTQIELTRLPLVQKLLVSRWPIFLLRVIALGGFLLAILAGLTGTPVGSRNFGIVFIWILWWAVLILVAVPFLGRGWCSICPIPLPGEWLQNGALLGPDERRRKWGLGRRWPKALGNIWLQNGAFVVLALFSIVVLTRPLVTAVVLILFLALAMGTSMVYERRAFCRSFCPVGGFIGLYSQLSPVEIRVKDTAVCVGHTQKTCYSGNEDGYGCPWGVFPGAMLKNNYCGMCMECLRTCPHDNIAVNLRPFGADLSQPGARKLDEAYKAFIMLGSAFVYAAVMLGPWGELKAAAFAVGTVPWGLYALSFLVFVLLVLPGGFSLAILAGRAISPVKKSIRRDFVANAYALIPLGLGAWIAFSLSFVFTNLSYIWPLLSDPLGWGWDLLGTAGISWVPYFSNMVPPLQIGVLVISLAWSVATARRISAELDPSDRYAKRIIPIVLFILVATLGLLWLLVG